MGALDVNAADMTISATDQWQAHAEMNQDGEDAVMGTNTADDSHGSWSLSRNLSRPALVRF